MYTLVDTSDDSCLTKNRRTYSERQTQKQTNLSRKFRYYKIPNGGIGYSYNFGIKKAIADNCDLITLFTDDVRVLNKGLPVENIRRFFEANCNPAKDALVLPQNPAELLIKKDRAADSGLTLSAQLFKTIRFREEFIFDQTRFRVFRNRYFGMAEIRSLP